MGYLKIVTVLKNSNFLHVFINYSRNAWPTKIQVLFLSFLDNSLQDVYCCFFFFLSVDNFEIVHKTLFNFGFRYNFLLKISSLSFPTMYRPETFQLLLLLKFMGFFFFFFFFHLFWSIFQWRSQRGWVQGGRVPWAAKNLLIICEKRKN